MKHASPKTCSYDVQVLLLKGAGVNHGQVADWYIPIPASIQPAIYTHAILPHSVRPLGVRRVHSTHTDYLR